MFSITECIEIKKQKVSLQLQLLALMFALTAWPSSQAHGYTDPLDTPSKKTNSAQASLILDVCQAGERLVAVGERGHILYSDDQGKSWIQAEVPGLVHLTAVNFATPSKGWAVGKDTVIMYTQDSGQTWSRQYDERDSDFPAPLLDVLFFDEQEGLAIGAYGKYLHTTDGGKTWKVANELIDNPDEWHFNAITRTPWGDLFIAGEAGTAYRSSDRGMNWDILDVPHEGSFLGVIAGDNEGQVVLFGIGGNLFSTDDNGENWKAIDVGTQASLAGGAPLGDGSMVIVGSDGVVIKLNSSNNKYTLHSRDDRMPLSSVVPTNDGSFVLVGLAGISRINGGSLGSTEMQQSSNKESTP
jgi:photosystem II stability/assembly factor-like uncharacterized protein